jgi:hypothetical protein
MQIPDTPQGARPQNGGEALSHFNCMRLAYCDRGNEPGLASMHPQPPAENVIRRIRVCIICSEPLSVVCEPRAECNRSDPAPINYSPPAKSAAANDMRRVGLIWVTSLIVN